MTTVEDLQEKAELMGGVIMPHTKLERGSYVLVVHTSQPIVSGFCYDGKTRIFPVSAYRHRADLGLIVAPQRRQVAMKLLFKNVREKYFAAWKEFLDGAGIKTVPKGNFIECWADDPLYSAPAGSDLGDFLRKYLG